MENKDIKGSNLTIYRLLSWMNEMECTAKKTYLAKITMYLTLHNECTAKKHIWPDYSVFKFT